ncbi:MAG: hypothetical protein K8J31_03990, partial [Anaerolineae bacterium]|nr:hypothetical protein [Anaerolineae bacterium]
METANFEYQKTNVLKLMETHMRDQNDEFKILTGKAQQNIGVSSIIFALVGILNITQDKKITFLLLLVLAVWLLIFALSYIVLSPEKWQGGPLNPEWDEIRRVIGKD